MRWPIALLLFAAAPCRAELPFDPAQLTPPRKEAAPAPEARKGWLEALGDDLAPFWPYAAGLGCVALGVAAARRWRV